MEDKKVTNNSENEKGGKKLRFGFTTGSCAAAASKAAAFMLLSGTVKDKISIETPKGITFNAEILEIVRKENEVSCAVRKYSGDDPDVTDGMLIYSKVSFSDNEDDNEVIDGIHGIEEKIKNKDNKENRETESIGNKSKNGNICNKSGCGIRIKGGIGIGKVTLPGLDQPVGEYAINHVPREMIQKEVSEVCRLFDHNENLTVEISAPEGVETAEKTFNPRLGIVGGISILGTSGIVEPMSEKALVETIRVELSMNKAIGISSLVVSPGNYGLSFIKEHYSYDLDKAVKCSNFIGDTVNMATDMGFKRFILIGHIGKLVKLAGGMLNTHSKYGDNRMKVIAEEAEKAGGSEEVKEEILKCISTDAAIDILKNYSEEYALSHNGESIIKVIMDSICARIEKKLREVCKDKMEIYIVMFSNVHGLLAESVLAEKIISDLTENVED